MHHLAAYWWLSLLFVRHPLAGAALLAVLLAIGWTLPSNRHR